MNRFPTLSRLLFVVSPVLLAHCGDPAPPNMLLITVDTLRADFLGPYGDASASTPHLDALSREGTVFERAAAPMPLTRPSHFSLLTSRYPREHGVVNNAMALPQEARTVAEILQQEGYETAAFLSVRLLDQSSGAAQGFAVYDAPAETSERAAEDTVARVRQWLAERDPARPFFLWIHLFDPHIPYAPPEAFRPAAVADAEAVDWPRLNAIAAKNGNDIPAGILEEAKLLYRGEIAYTDHWIGELLTAVDRHSDPDDTLVVFTADHGECFENGSYFEHSDCLFEPAVHIPLIVRFRRHFPPGTRVATQSSIVDIAPTMLHGADLEIPADFSGKSLQEIDQYPDRYVLIQHPFYQGKLVRVRPRRRHDIRSVGGNPRREMLVDQEQVGVVGTEWKYLRSGDNEMLFRISPNTDETTDLSGREEVVRTRMLERLRRELADHPLQLIDPSGINPELLETLSALGYLDN